MALWLATFADSDGSNVTVGIDRMAARLGYSRRTLFRCLADLRQLGFLVDGSLTKFKGTRRRTLNVAALKSASAVVPSTADVPSTSSAKYAPSEVPSTDSEVPSTRSDVPCTHEKQAESHVLGTQPSVGQPSVRTEDQTDHPTGSTENENLGWMDGGGPEPNTNSNSNPATMEKATPKPTPTLSPDSMTDDDELTAEQFEAEGQKALESWEAYTWKAFLGGLPEELLGAVANKRQEALLRKQCYQHSPEIVWAALREWIQRRELPIEDRKFNKWGAWLAEGMPFLENAKRAARKAKKAEDANRLAEAARDATMKEKTKLMLSIYGGEKTAPKVEGGENPYDYFSEEAK
jgi:hypothetical protein